MQFMSENKWEKYLFKFTVVCIGVLIGTQMLMFQDTFRHYFSQLDHVEGTSLITQENVSTESSWFEVAQSRLAAVSLFMNRRKSKSLVLRMVEPKTSDDVWVMVNGAKIANFHDGEVNLLVYEGDYVEIDSSILYKKSRFIVKVPHGDLVTPTDGMTFDGVGSVIAVGKVK
jgi:hypothetical protein